MYSRRTIPLCPVLLSERVWSENVYPRGFLTFLKSFSRELLSGVNVLESFPALPICYAPQITSAPHSFHYPRTLGFLQVGCHSCGPTSIEGRSIRDYNRTESQLSIKFLYANHEFLTGVSMIFSPWGYSDRNFWDSFCD